VRAHCQAHARGLAETIPAARKKAAVPVTSWSALAVISRKRLLMVRRPAQGLLAGLWCLPLVAGGERGPDPDAVRALLGRKLAFASVLPKVRHVFTHRIWDMHPAVADLPRRPTRSGPAVAWVAAGDRPPGGVPTATEKLLRAVGY
jgi:A/G-specific adenine glycosylase